MYVVIFRFGPVLVLTTTHAIRYPQAHERKRYEMQQILADLQAVKPAFIIMRAAFDKLDTDNECVAGLLSALS